MTTLLFRDRRRSRYLFDWSARWALERNSLDAITGQAATYSRASIGTSIDSAGRIQIAGYGQPRFDWRDFDADGIRESPCLLLEDTRTNVVLWNRDMTNAAWVKTGMTAAKDQTGVDGLVNSASSLISTGINGTCAQSITLGSSVRCQGAWIRRLVGTGLVQMTTDGGTTWVTLTLTTAWQLFSIPTQTLANPSVGFRVHDMNDKIAVDFVQNENGVTPSSSIATTTVAVTRAADALSFAWNAPPIAMTTYAKFIDLGSQATSAGILDVGGNNATPRLVLLSSPTTYRTNHSGVSAAIQSTTATSGDLIELRGVMNADGSTLAGVSKNGAAEGSATDPTTQPLEAAWATPNLYFNRYAPTTIGYAAFTAVRIAAGAQSQAIMREG